MEGVRWLSVCMVKMKTHLPIRVLYPFFAGLTLAPLHTFNLILAALGFVFAEVVEVLHLHLIPPHLPNPWTRDPTKILRGLLSNFPLCSRNLRLQYSFACEIQ